VPRVVVPQLAGGDAASPQARQPEVTADVDIGPGVQRENLLLRAGQERHGGRVPLDQPDGERVEQDVLRAWERSWSAAKARSISDSIPATLVSRRSVAARAV
jgi:hypothetical protein